MSVALRAVLNIVVGALFLMTILVVSLLLVGSIEYVAEKLRFRRVLRAVMIIYLFTLLFEVLNMFGGSIIEYFIKGGP